VLEFLKPAFQNAKKDLVKEITKQVRIYTQNQGWPANIAKTLSVKESGKSYKIDSPQFKTQVFDLEHLGNSDVSKGTLRRFGNMNSEFGKIFVILFNSQIEKSSK
jgi:hypothetical protein